MKNNNKNTPTIVWYKAKKLFDKNGEIENISIILDKKNGLIKYGEANNLLKEYNSMIEAYISCGFKYMCTDLVFIDLTDYKTFLTKKQLGTLVNFTFLLEKEGRKVLDILKLSKEDMLQEVRKISSDGYEIDEYIC